MKSLAILLTLLLSINLQAKDEHHPTASSAVAAEKALGWLKNGNTRFTTQKLRKDGQTAEDRERLSGGQKPHTIVLSCSDSRVPPEIVFDQKLGEIFVVRTAGEALDNSGIASIEYAVAHLGVKLILVLGHESCGAVKAALATLDGSDAGSPALNALTKDLHPRLQSFRGKSPSTGHLAEARVNVQGVAADLLARSTIISDNVKKNGLVVKSGVYHLASGRVEFLD